MSDKSGVSEQVLSLPSGGGALEGTGGQFATQRQTGAGSFSLPIETPDGRAGLQPDLELTYSTGNGDGSLGLGWTIGVPTISRKTKTGVPVYDDAEDTFLLAGEEDLVPIDQQTTDGGTTVTNYKPRTEETFDRIKHHRSETTNHWTVEAKDGTVRRYGAPESTGDDPAVVADPGDRSKVFRWQLTEAVDPFGNRIVYDYARDTGDTDNHYWDQLYLDRIRYVDYKDNSDETQFLITVNFEYEDRPDPTSWYRCGFEIRTRKRCSRIVVCTHADTDRPIRSYELTYLDELPDDNSLANGESQLARIQMVGHADGETQRLPPVEFDYSRFNPEERNFTSIEGSVPRRSLATPELELADLSGNGLPDIVEINDSIRYWRNIGDGKFADPRRMNESPAGLTLDDPNVQLIDADGDGRIDLTTFDTPLSGYFPLEPDGGWSEESFQPYDHIPIVDFDAPNVQLADFDGNGATDALRSGNSLVYFFQDREEGWNDTRTITGALDEVEQLDFSDPRMRLGDFSGDGLQDIVMVDDGHISYWPNLGHGDWGQRVRMRNPPNLPRNYDPGRVLIGDIDGDGLADLLYVKDDSVTLWINRSGNGWSDPLVVQGTPSVTNTDAIRLVDIEGDGIGGLLYSGGGRPGNDEMYFLDFTSNQKPYLMTEIRNNMGATTRVEYAPSTEFYLKDERNGEEWKTTLPQPTWVVSRVESIDEISKGKLTTEYSYHHGYWDGAEREFRGFGMVEQTDTESFEEYNSEGLHSNRQFAKVTDRERFSPPTLTKTWFHVGPVGPEHGDWRELDFTDEFWDGDQPMFDRPGETQRLFNRLSRREQRDAIRSLRGKTIRTEVYALDGSDRRDSPYTISEQSFGIRDESPAGATRPDRHPVFFPHLVRSRETSWERGADPQTQITISNEYDRYGQPQSQIEIALPRGWTPRTKTDEYLVTHGRTTYAHRDDEAQYIVDRVTEQTQYEIVPGQEYAVDELITAINQEDVDRQLIGLTRNYYDGEAFSGLSLGEVGKYGALVRTEELVLTDDIIAEAYPQRSNPPDGSGAPPYLVADTPSWSDEYPIAFRNGVAERAGYVVSEDLPNAAVADTGYFSLSHQVAYDFQQQDRDTERGLLAVERDPLGNKTTVALYDPYDLNPKKVVDPHGLVTKAEYDYAAMKLRQITDPNHNRTRNNYTPLGMVESVSKLGSAGNDEGDVPEQPSKRFLYDLRAFERSPRDDPEPAYVHTIERERHRWDIVRRENERRRDRGNPELTDQEIEGLFPRDPDTDIPERSEIEQYPERFVQLRQYSDGFGRIVQRQQQAADRVFGADETFGAEVLSSDGSGNATIPVDISEVDDEHRVRVSGWKTYDNKGNVVEQYEPFFRTTGNWEFASRSEAARSGSETIGQHTEIFYDALGRKTRTVNPDGSTSRVVRGTIDEDRLDDPDVYDPTPWEVFEYDANDSAGRTHGTEAADYEHHWNTPTSRRLDALGRTVETVERNRTANGGQGGPADGDGIERYRTHREYDIRGNVVSITDRLGRTAFVFSYDLADNRIRMKSIDAGTRRIVRDAAGNEGEARDAKGALELRLHDASNRLTHEWARDGDDPTATRTPTLRRRVFHGETDGSLSRAEAKVRNLLGSVSRSYDEAGLLEFGERDFKGNPIRKERRVLDDDAVVQQPVDWTSGSGNDLADRESDLLASRAFETNLEYDAQDRVTRTVYPQDVDGQRKALCREYDRAGALSGVDLVVDPGGPNERIEPYVADVGYNALGERTIVAFGNGVMVRYAYDDRTKRLARQLAQPYETTADGSYAPNTSSTRTTLQDLRYEYDLLGNVREIRNRTPHSGVTDSPGGADQLDRRFEYDALNRLTQATGREATDVPSPRPWADTAPTTASEHRYGVPDVTRQNAPQHAALYTEQYEYDAAGNMTEMRHRGASDWTRTFGIGGSAPDAWTGDGWSDTPQSNRMTHVRDRQGLSQPTHEYDDAGNLLRERNTLLGWGHGDRLRSYKETAQNGRPSVEAAYAYDPKGKRVKKVVHKTGRTDVTVYVDGIFEYRRREFDAPNRDPRENNTLHVADDQDRVALIRVGDPLDPDDPTPRVRYHHGDHLDSSTLVVDTDGDWIDYEEFTPFGETALGGYARKRYRYTGTERDEESGLYYAGKRYYAPWIARWTSTDPRGTADGLNLYTYVRNDPINRTDPTGGESHEQNESGESEPGNGTSGSGGTGGGSSGSGGRSGDEETDSGGGGSGDTSKAGLGMLAPLFQYTGKVSLEGSLGTGTSTTTGAEAATGLSLGPLAAGAGVFISVTLYPRSTGRGRRRRRNEEVRVHHGTKLKMAPQIMTTGPKTSNYPGHDFGNAFYMTPTFSLASKYAWARSNPKKDEVPTVGTVSFEKGNFESVFGKVMDIRVNSTKPKHRELYKNFMKQTPEGGPLPGASTRAEMLSDRRYVEERRRVFRNFLDHFEDKMGFRPDTVVGHVFTPGITNEKGKAPKHAKGTLMKHETEDFQIAVRNPENTRLHQMFIDAEWTPVGGGSGN